MRIANRTTAVTLRAASFFIVSTVAAASAMATTGSTDIYSSNGIATSFGTPSTRPVGGSEYRGSTDMYGVSGFAASFGHSGSVRQADALGRDGSTDVYGYKGFAASFGMPAPRDRRGLTVSR